MELVGRSTEVGDDNDLGLELIISSYPVKAP